MLCTAAHVDGAQCCALFKLPLGTGNNLMRDLASAAAEVVVTAANNKSSVMVTAVAIVNSGLWSETD